METSMADQIAAAAALTTTQLEHAIEIVEAQFGADLEQKHSSLNGAVLVTLPENNRQLPRVRPTGRP